MFYGCVRCVQIIIVPSDVDRMDLYYISGTIRHSGRVLCITIILVINLNVVAGKKMFIAADYFLTWDRGRRRTRVE
jgi:hypothetical protein